MRRNLSTLVLSFALAAPLSAATITVDTLSDDSDSAAPCSLREAILNANSDAAGRGCAAGSGDDTIVFHAGLNGQIALVLGELPVYESVEIVVEPAHRIGVRATPDERIFRVYDGLELRLDGLVLEGGRAGSEAGGAVYSPSGSSLEVADCIFRDNEASDGGAIEIHADTDSSLPVLRISDSRFENNRAVSGVSGYGGAVFVRNSSDFSTESSPSAIVERSVFLGNHSDAFGAALTAWSHFVRLDRVAAFWNESDSIGGGMSFNGSSVDMVNSTVALNSGTYATLSFASLDTGHTVRVAHSTVTGNEASVAGQCSGACFTANSSQSPITLVFNSIVADNVGGPDCTGGYGFTTGGNNVFGDVTGCETPVASDLETAAPLVLYYGEMASDARDTIVALPSSSSPVVDRIPAEDCDDVDGSPLLDDQRGGVRPKRAYVPLPGAPPAACDSGALERGFAELALWIFKDGFEGGNPLQWSRRAP